MKASLFSLIAAAALLASSSAFAAAPGPPDRYNDRNSKDFNYGYDRNHRVTAKERARWEAAQRRDDRNDRKDDRRDDRRDDRKDDRRDDRNDRDFNYGYDRGHRVTPQEQARWEAAHRTNNRR